MIIDIHQAGMHYIAILPESRLVDQDIESLKARIRNHGYYPGQLRY